MITKKYGKFTVVDEYSHTDYIDRENGVIITSVIINDGDVYISVIDAEDINGDFNPIGIKEKRYIINLYDSGDVHFTSPCGECKKYKSIKEMMKENKAAYDMLNRHDYRHVFDDGLDMISTIFKEYNSLHVNL
ncbi:hypothetical protein [Ruminococcus albus]|uniref:Uncharacterized protein n=1 Tax=Ruminococcus albus 8 TaxID=246199 RepID=E9S8Z2_RUMAL|nr:hypothetical protein [Ruminococcus albus]EGC04254.1 hypothetical protein CUS_5637 [Ruminococcus albus 8]MCC3349714.1 hypothetical protein [Ruminococcus albus 8]